MGNIKLSSQSQTLPPSVRLALFNAALACFLMILTGSTFSLGVFTLFIEQNAVPIGALNGVWPCAMGLMHFVSAPITITSGLFLDAATTHISPDHTIPVRNAKTARVRTLLCISSLAFALLILAAAGSAVTSASLVALGVVFQAVPLGILNELLAAWYPQSAGTAIGCGQLAFGLGTILFAPFFERLIALLGHEYTICVTAILLSVDTAIISFFIEWPPRLEQHDQEASADENDALLGPHDHVVKISWRKLVRLSPFWLYIAVVFTSGSGYAFIPFYFKLGDAWGRPLRQVITWFQVSGVASAVFGLLGTACTDVMQFGSGFFHSGSKNVITLYLFVQTVLYCCLSSLTQGGHFVLFMMSLTMLDVIAATHAGCAALLARDIFGAKNSCLVFGIGAGLALGTGEGLSAWIMSAVEGSTGKAGSDIVASDYTLFYWISATWSFAGLASILALRKCQNAFRVHATPVP